MLAGKFSNLEINHIAFNAKRTLRTANSSQFELVHMHGLSLLKDAAIGFANQIWGINQQTIAHLPAALAVYANINQSPELDINQTDLTAKIGAQLASLNFEMVELLNFLSLECQAIPAPAVNSDIHVTRLMPSDADLFLALLETSGMQTNAEIWNLKKHLYCTDVFRCFVAKVDGVACGLATLYIDNQFGLLANAFVQPKFRNLGCQSVLLNARLQDAKKSGLKQLIVDVVPNSSSERNCVKFGFKAYETRFIWRKVNGQTKPST
ncbi:MAG: GNAT family N-acetyltransferase [Rhizobiales bacterium]|nr:GNAT family N-acetyltransferase [Hyphomicrobiales bacterium]NRB13506.1 GNAT family N-acetyltransferase [Hyphomicrobiales bacterium]